MNLSKYVLAFFLTHLIMSSCKKFVEVPTPQNLTISSQVFTDDNKASSAIAGIYSKLMPSGPAFSNYLTTANAGILSDELIKYNPGMDELEFINNDISLINSQPNFFWTRIYEIIYYTNVSIEGIESSTGMSAQAKTRLLGDCKFVRAFCYFYLINLFGDVPLILSSDYNINAKMPRSPKELVYQSIVSDLNDAKSRLATNYFTAQKGRPNKWAVSALLARVYLYMKDWEKAEANSTEVISSNVYTPLLNLNTVFLANSNEAIWQLSTASIGRVPELFSAFVSSTPIYYMSPFFINAFENGDLRRTKWMDSIVYLGTKYYYPGKYKDRNITNNTEHYMVLRVGEQFLIRAEARAENNSLSGAIADINIIRARAGLTPLPNSLTKAQIITAIEAERKSELFGEWGHRWFDLKRTGRADAVLAPIKGNHWQSTDVLWPIPETQIIANINLVQNPGY